MSTASVNYVYLESNPKSAYKQLFVKGTRIPARALYGWYACEEPMTADEIAADYNLPVEAVREAIAYCESNPPELREDYARQEASMAAMGFNHPNYDGKPKPLTAEQRAKLRAPRGSTLTTILHRLFCHAFSASMHKRSRAASFRQPFGLGGGVVAGLRAYVTAPCSRRPMDVGD